MVGSAAAATGDDAERPALTAQHASERLRWQLAVDAAGIGSFDWDLRTDRLRWDDHLVALFGYERDGFDETFEAFETRVHPDDRARVAAALQGAIQARGGFEAEYRIVRHDGALRWIHARGRVLLDADGSPSRLIGAALDTTAGREADARLGRLLESMSAAFYSLDAEWRFSYVNAEAERLLGRPRGELLGGVVWELFPWAAGSDFETHFRAAVATGEPRAFEAYYPPPLDAWYELRAWPGPDGLSVYFLDITAR
ncbi:PAS domain-containing protein, partial [Kineococcus glutinatus]|uniref:PAS domain-containing protein n=1 Tax=Kineococcus glutinatus TaxID=1070872 RepID=UPI0031E577F5